MIRRRPISLAYRSLVHAIYYIGPEEHETIHILETARRELFQEKYDYTKYPQHGHHCGKCHRYSRRHTA